MAEVPEVRYSARHGALFGQPQPSQRAQQHRPAPPDDPGFAWRVAETTAIVLGVLLLASLVPADVLLLLFGAVLLAAVLRAATNDLVAFGVVLATPLAAT
jgi:hypothetical protein